MRRLHIICLALAIGLVGCPKPVSDVTELDWSPVEGAPAELQEQFDRAVQAYLDGDYPAAIDRFRVFGASYPTHPLSVRAEFFLGRSLAADGQLSEALRIFESLRAVPDEPRTEMLAGLYVAYVHGRRGEPVAQDEAMEQLLAVYPEITFPEGWVLPGDEGHLASTLAEALVKRARFVDACFALEVVAYNAPDDHLLLYAYDRAAELVETRLDYGQLEQLLIEGTPFLRVLVGAPMVAHHVSGGDGESAQQILDEVRDNMVDAGLLDRLNAAESMIRSVSEEGAPRYGLLVTLTGPNRRAGRAVLGAALLAQRAFDESDPRSTLVVRDSFGSATGVEIAMNEFAELGVSVVIGPVEPDLSETARGIADDLDVPFISLAPTPFDEAMERTVRLQIDAASEAAAAVVEATETRESSRFVIVRDADASPDAYLSIYAEAVSELVYAATGQDADVFYVSAEESIQESASEAARAIHASDADTVVLALDAEGTGAVASHLASLNVWPSPDGSTRDQEGRRRVTYILTSVAAEPSLLVGASDYLVGAIIPVWYHADWPSGAPEEFTLRFEGTYGRSPGVLEAFAYDATSFARSLMLDAHYTGPARFGRALELNPVYNGVVGEIRFDELGNPVLAPRLMTVSQGAYVPSDE